jgi:hypothetical protein
MRTVGEVRAAQVIDVVPGGLERWVLHATQEVGDSLLSADEWVEDSEETAHLRSHGLRLRSEYEQAEAHSRRWQERFDGQYGDIVIYELRSDEPIVYERTEEHGQPALLMGHAREDGPCPRRHARDSRGAHRPESSLPSLSSFWLHEIIQEQIRVPTLSPTLHFRGPIGSHRDLCAGLSIRSGRNLYLRWDARRRP